MADALLQSFFREVLENGVLTFDTPVGRELHLLKTFCENAEIFLDEPITLDDLNQMLEGTREYLKNHPED